LVVSLPLFFLYLYQVESLSQSCADLGCPQCVGSSEICCGGIVPPFNETYCNLYCLEEGQTCCGCNPLSNGQFKCFGCNTGNTCVDQSSHNLTGGGLPYFCGSSSHLFPTIIGMFIVGFLLFV